LEQVVVLLRLALILCLLLLHQMGEEGEGHTKQQMLEVMVVLVVALQ
jgi:hypothetical protein